MTFKVNLALNIVKPLGVQWLHDLYDYMLARPEIVINGFRRAGLLNQIQCIHIYMLYANIMYTFYHYSYHVDMLISLY